MRRISIWAAARRALTIFRDELRGTVKRQFKAASRDRLTADWATLPVSANRELRVSLRTLRNRVRVLGQNDDYFKKFLSMVAANVPGPKGMMLRLDFVDQTADGRRQTAGGSQRSEVSTERDNVLAEEIKASFAEWSRPENCSVSGKLSFVEQQRLFIRTVARDGEVLVRKVLADNPWGFALKFIDVAWLDEFYNQTLPNGNRILMSVEVDGNDRPVAYWVTMPSTEYLFNARPKGAPFRQRVPASEFIHAFLTLDDESQVRGLPWAHTAMLRLHILNGYEEAELYASRAGACVTDYLLPPKNDEFNEFFTREDVATNTPEGFTPGAVREIEPAGQQIVPPGWDVKSNDPKHPNTNYIQFVKGVLRGVAAGLEVSYNSLANDLEGVSYSSIRAGLLEERDVWRSLQQFMIDHFHHPVFVQWLRLAMLSGAVDLSLQDYARVKDYWKPRGWAWVDPLKDVQATILAVNNFLETRSGDADERGEDFLENLKLLDAEAQAIDATGLKLPANQPAKANPTAADQGQADQGQSAGADGSNQQNAADNADGSTRVLPVFESQLLPESRPNGRDAS